MDLAHGTPRNPPSSQMELEEGNPAPRAQKRPPASPEGPDETDSAEY